MVASESHFNHILTSGGGGGYSLHLMVGGMRPEKKYRGVRELLFIPRKGGVRELE